MDRLIDFIKTSPILAGLFILVLVAYGLFEFLVRSRGVKRILPQELSALTNRHKALVIDLRSEEQFSKGHIAGARNYPKDQIDTQLSKLEKYKQKPLILVCQHGRISTSVGSQLKKQGFEQLYSLTAGLEQWQKDNYPLVTNKSKLNNQKVKIKAKPKKAKTAKQ